MTGPATPDPEDRAASTSLGELLGEVSRDLSTLFRQEVELAKAELKDSATRAGRGAGLMGGAGVAGHLAIVFISLAIWWALGNLVGLGWSAVIVAVIWAIVAFVLLSMGRRELKAVRGMPSTADSLKKIPETIKEAGTQND
jgi:Putative Actinobacterial Holin-X, holin superfamily III